jgi:hypothetical protein
MVLHAWCHQTVSRRMQSQQQEAKFKLLSVACQYLNKSFDADTGDGKQDTVAMKQNTSAQKMET